MGLKFTREIQTTSVWESSIELLLTSLLAVLVVRCHIGFSLVAASPGSPLRLRWVGFSLRWLLLLGSTGSRAPAQELQLPGSRAQAHELWCRGLAAPQWVGSPQTSDKPVSPALTGEFFTTEPPGKPYFFFMNVNIFYFTI